MQSRHKIVKAILRASGLYFLYSIGTVVRKQMVLEQARTIREQQIRFGGNFELSEQKKKILQEADQYINGHAGFRLLNRMRTEEFYEQQFNRKIKEKEQALAETDPEDKDRIQKLKSHLDQLNKAYKSVVPKMPTSWEDFKDKDEDEED